MHLLTHKCDVNKFKNNLNYLGLEDKTSSLNANMLRLRLSTMEYDLSVCSIHVR